MHSNYMLRYQVYMKLIKLVKLNNKGQLVTILVNPENYAQQTCGLMRGTWASSKEEAENYLNEERENWK